MNTIAMKINNIESLVIIIIIIIIIRMRMISSRSSLAFTNF